MVGVQFDGELMNSEDDCRLSVGQTHLVAHSERRWGSGPLNLEYQACIVLAIGVGGRDANHDGLSDGPSKNRILESAYYLSRPCLEREGVTGAGRVEDFAVVKRAVVVDRDRIASGDHAGSCGGRVGRKSAGRSSCGRWRSVTTARERSCQKQGDQQNSETT